ncbi:vWA domain-containing protein [Chondrinema litorale]|uniref:vWA domain-containing protein n=1 Tax=Chondrinema litorale TaxID=2994555 RepID=UPI002542DFF4|nr:VWA domain-containing protein [Chondrinema litorale]UZR99673.1 VWA domain-containing protein [Chondrinema litorale]
MLLKGNDFAAKTPDIKASVKHFLVHNRFEQQFKATCNQKDLLIVFLVDSSASMAKQKIISYVKGLIQKTLEQQTRHKPTFALIALLQGDATVISTPTKNKKEIIEQLQILKTGGKTNMAAGITKTYHLVKQASSLQKFKMFILTDGKINQGKTKQPFEEAILTYKKLLKVAGSSQTEVIDTDQSFVQFGLAEKFAKGIGARYSKLQN